MRPSNYTGTEDDGEGNVTYYIHGIEVTEERWDAYQGIMAVVAERHAAVVANMNSMYSRIMKGDKPSEGT